ncbi:xaa-Pro dipeptidase [Halyomorpha halys]|uniref:xaa-Pro dipeptidase n=1 Tax=Halyomorpha halys TaxID=286706 RepID=UPI0006D5056B|nr:xaa-Pro dipeptidase-like [Halyomorpha halys]
MAIHRRDTKNKPRWKDEYDAAPQVPFISKGDLTLKVPMTLFCENRKRLADELRKGWPRALVVIEAARTSGCSGTGSYAQDPFFFWAFGYDRPRAIGAINVVSNRAHLIVSRPCKAGFEWGEKRLNRKQIKKKFLVDNVWYLDELNCFLDFMTRYNDCREILILNYQRKNLPSCVFNYNTDYLTLIQVISEVVAHKTESEIKILHYIIKHLEGAFMHIMQRFRPGITDNQLEAWFSFFMSYKSDFKDLGFCIFTGDDVVDYNYFRRGLPVSKRQKVFKEGELCIIEAGASYFGYKLSLGMVIPVSETFDNCQKKTYEAMLRMRVSVSRELKAEAPLEHIQETAEKSLIQILIELKLLYGTVEGAFENGIGKILIPYCLVRSMDVGCEDPKKLELGKTYLVQPGCYFSKRWLEGAYEDEVLKRYLTPELRQYQGIVAKVSDPIIITVDGFRYLSNMPRAWATINEMRSKDQLRIGDFTIEQQKENLKVRPSTFRI